MEQIKKIFRAVYDGKKGEESLPALVDLIDSWRERVNNSPAAAGRTEGSGSWLPLDQQDAFIITYGDQFHGPEEMPLEYLHRFFSERLEGIVSGIHILPFFPYSSDDGFSIIDYRLVNPEWGTWEQIRKISQGFRLMADLVLNHCSVKSEWFKEFLNGTPPYDRYFIEVDPQADISSVFRPRAHPLLTPFQGHDGEKLVWTTFSADQADLNFAEPQVMLEMLDIFLFYLSQGVQVLRLDAIAYLWKELGTPCLHHPKTHLAVKLFRAVAEELAPGAVIITETNVPHQENISYFGEGDQAHMVYQFPLPPLTVDAFLRGDAGHLRDWASSLPAPDGKTTFFNFLASHDGIGVLPANGILSEEEKAGMIESVQERGGLISYKAAADGHIPYEMNVNFLDAVADPNLSPELQSDAFLASQAIMLSLPGVPGIYIHSLIGSRGDREGVRRTGHNRSINRQKLDYEEITGELDRRGASRNRIFNGYLSMLEVRRSCPAFHPAAGMQVLPASGPVFALFREASQKECRVVCLVNTSAEPAEWRSSKSLRFSHDLLSGKVIEEEQDIILEAYQVLWLKLAGKTE
ncbi:MAG: sugar phosphorylase [Spirochaetales bacterium]|nr:sugar phosphorylase [Spirochaetales bacterium]MCF7937837.1 sugar phosphorylase [Spirochaetales bacterium]